MLKVVYRKSRILRLLYEYYFYFIDRLIGYRAEKKNFLKAKGYYPNLEKPLSFSEKIIWKKINDRNPLLPVTADKYGVRFYLEEILGTQTAAEILIPLLHVTAKPDTIPFDRLPTSYIVKANHGSGWNLIVENNNKSKAEILAHCRLWLTTPYGLRKNEWAYLNIKRKIVIEELLRDEEGKSPKDFRFYMFHGQCRYIRVSIDRFGIPANSSFTPDWTFLPMARNLKKQGPTLVKPKNYESMLSLAEKLSQPFDFVRVDLYNINGKIYFGELTHYPRSGQTDIPESFDSELGQYWNLKPQYWLE